MVRLLVVGKDDFTYNRTAVLIAGLEAHPLVDLTVHTLTQKSRQEGKALSQITQEHDYVLVPAFRHTDMRFVKRWSKAPVIFDPLISKYLTKVIDYRQYHKVTKYFIDYRAFHKADLLIADTDCHRRYYQRVFGVPFTQSVTIPVGVNTDEYTPVMTSQTPHCHQGHKAVFVVGFYGSFVPLQGTSIILEAARILLPHLEIEFRIIGTGYTYQAAKDLVSKYQLTNVNLLGWVEQGRLKDEIDEFDLCLGIFGSSEKADSVVPNKIYHYAALAKPTITKDTPAIREVFDTSSMELTRAESQDLANAILRVMNNKERQLQLGKAAHQVIQSGYTHHHVAQRLVDRLQTGL